MVFKGQYRRYSRELKLAALERMERGESIGALAQELGVRASRLNEWRQTWRLCGDVSSRVRARPPSGEGVVDRPAVRKAMERGAGDAEPVGVAGLAAAKRRIAELEHKIGQQELDLDFFQQALRRVGAKRPSSGGNGGTGSTKSSKP
jgi:transposase